MRILTYYIYDFLLTICYHNVNFLVSYSLQIYTQGDDLWDWGVKRPFTRTTSARGTCCDLIGQCPNSLRAAGGHGGYPSQFCASRIDSGESSGAGYVATTTHTHARTHTMSSKIPAVAGIGAVFCPTLNVFTIRCFSWHRYHGHIREVLFSQVVFSPSTPIPVPPSSESQNDSRSIFTLWSSPLIPFHPFSFSFKTASLACSHFSFV